MNAFINDSLSVKTLNGPGAGHDFILLEPLVFVTNKGLTVRAPSGAETDGISTPRFVWNIIPPFGKTWFPGIVHDSAYRNTLEMQTHKGNWIPAHFDQQQSDDLMDDALAAQGVSDIERATIVEALRKCGGIAFAEDRKPIT